MPEMWYPHGPDIRLRYIRKNKQLVNSQIVCEFNTNRGGRYSLLLSDKTLWPFSIFLFFAASAASDAAAAAAAAATAAASAAVAAVAAAAAAAAAAAEATAADSVSFYQTVFCLLHWRHTS